MSKAKALPIHVRNNKLKGYYSDYINQKWVINSKYGHRKPHYFFDDSINITNFDPNKIPIDDMWLRWICGNQRFEIH